MINKNILYFATFAAGMQYIVKDLLIKHLKDIRIHQLFEGAVLFETEATYDKLNLFCFNNIFSVITYSPKKNIDDIRQFILDIINSKLQSKIISKNTKKYKTFRVIISSENKLISIDKNIKIKLEKFISSQSGLKINRENSDAEFWICYRTEGFYYFMKRLSKHKNYEKILNKGELHPEIAYIMNWFSEVNKKDIVLDPFCGNGSIPIKRALNFPTEKIYAFDINNDMVKITNKNINSIKSLSVSNKIVTRQLDIKYLSKELKNESIDKIVTDPPWGLYKNIGGEINKFYELSISQMEKVLKNNGIIVLLLSREIDIESIIKNYKVLKILYNYNVLISGKKANIVKIKKMRGFA